MKGVKVLFSYRLMLFLLVCIGFLFFFLLFIMLLVMIFDMVTTPKRWMKKCLNKWIK